MWSDDTRIASCFNFNEFECALSTDVLMSVVESVSRVISPKSWLVVRD